MLKLVIKIIASSSILAFNGVSVASPTGIVAVNNRLVETAYSFAPVIAIAAFLVGAVSLFTAITTMRNHAENPKEYPLKNIVYYGVAAAVGLGYAYSASTMLQTLFEKDDSGDYISEDIFDTKTSRSDLFD